MAARSDRHDIYIGTRYNQAMTLLSNRLVFAHDLFLFRFSRVSSAVDWRHFFSPSEKVYLPREHSDSLSQQHTSSIPGEATTRAFESGDVVEAHMDNLQFQNTTLECDLCAPLTDGSTWDH